MINLIQLENWSVQSLLEPKVNYSNRFNFAKISEFLIKNRSIINIENNKEYKRVTVKINNNGVILRDIAIGLDIGTKKQFFAKAGQFIISKIDARNGAFGIIPDELDGAIVTNDFPVFDVDESKINPHFLLLITTTAEFIKFAQSCSSGTTNRQRMDIDLFLNQKIPLPPISIQNEIVANYNNKIRSAEVLLSEANNLEGEIENYFLQQLGLNPFQIKGKNTKLQITSYENLDRWDFFSTNTRISTELKTAKYTLSTIGQSFEFIRRSFNKLQFKNSTFRYIEIGAIDANKGILTAKTVDLKNAPSRANQVVRQGDLIIGTTRPYLKKFAIVNSEYDGCVCSSGFSIIKPSANYYLPYLHQFLKCSYGVEQLKNKMTGGLYPAITESELKEIKIPFPSIEKQKEIMSLITFKRENILINTELITSIKIEAQKSFENLIFS
jgi:restriction endonuclease S subunit